MSNEPRLYWKITSRQHLHVQEACCLMLKNGSVRESQAYNEAGDTISVMICRILVNDTHVPSQSCPQTNIKTKKPMV